MKKAGFAGFLILVVLFAHTGSSMASFFGNKLMFWGSRVQVLTPVNGQVEIPLTAISDGAAHHFKVQASDGTMVTFFTLKSNDGVIRAAIDACDVCYKAGKGYVQEGDYMVCLNCGQKFHESKINVLRGGCNPAPLERRIVGDKLIVQMADIDKNRWYCKFKG